MENKNEKLKVSEGLGELHRDLESSRNELQEIHLSNEFPKLERLFMEQHRQRDQFLKVLSKELGNLDAGTASVKKKDANNIYDGFHTEVKGTDSSGSHVLGAMIDRDIELVRRYQEVLALDGLPGTTNAILQSQAESMNSNIEKFSLDLDTPGTTSDRGIAKKEKKSQIRKITD